MVRIPGSAHWPACLLAVTTVLGGTALTPAASAVRAPEAAAPPPGPELFSQAADTPALLGDREPWELRRDIVKVNESVLRQLCDPPDAERPNTLTLNLFPQVTVVAEADEIGKGIREDTLEWTGGIADLPDSSVTLTAVGLCDETPTTFALGGSVKFNGEEYTIEARPNGEAMISEIDTRAMGLLQKPDKPRKPGNKRSTGHRTPSGQPPRNPTHRRAQPQPRSVIDLLVLYTPGAVSEAGGQDNVQGWITDAVARANDNLADSRVDATFRIVHMAQTTDYTGQETVVPAFNHLTDAHDGQLDQAQQLRDQYGADLVTTVVKGYDPANGIAGLASFPENPKNPNSSDDAWSVVAGNQLWSYLLAHELGHLLGLDHDWRTSPERSASLPDNHGYIPPGEEFVTIMGYPNACSRPCAYAGYFANPNLTHDGLPLGVPLGKGDQPADNTHVMNQTAPEIAAYRAPKTALPKLKLAITSDPPAGGTAKPETVGPYSPGDAVTVGVKPAAGYSFAGWTLDGKPAGSNDPLSVEVRSDHALVARFTQTGRTVTYNVAAAASPAGGGTVTLNPPGPAYEEGTPVLATAKAAAGYELTGWKLDGNPAGDDAKLTVLPSANHSLTAEFAPEGQKVTTNVSPAGAGKITLSPDGPYAAGADAVASATPSDGYAFDYWELNGKRDESEAVTSFNVGSAENLTAHFKKAPGAATPQAPPAATPQAPTTVTETPPQVTMGPPTVTVAKPVRGPITGGTKVVITGTGLDGITSVTFGGVPAPSWTARFDVKGVDIITAIAPPHAAGRVPIVIVTGTGATQVGTITFTYVKKRS